MNVKTDLYCGIDVHKDSYTGCVMDVSGNIVREHEFQPSKDAIERFVCGIPNAEMEIAIEACGIWRSAYKTFTDLGYNVKLANPKKTHDIACNKKMDKVDAKTLADLLRTNYLPEVYIPDEKILELRDLTRHKVSLMRLRVGVQVKIKAYLLRDGVKYGKNIWTEKALSDLAEKDTNIRNLVNVYWSLKAEENEVLRRIRSKARNMKNANLLMSMIGIAEYSALLILAEIADINRFKTPKELVSYAGLCPGIYQTGNTERNVKNNAVNKLLKWILYECSGRAIILDPRFQKYFYRIKKNKGYKTAKRAAARKMAVIIWHILTKEEPYNAS